MDKERKTLRQREREIQRHIERARETERKQETERKRQRESEIQRTKERERETERCDTERKTHKERHSGTSVTSFRNPSLFPSSALNGRYQTLPFQIIRKGQWEQSHAIQRSIQRSRLQTKNASNF